MCLLLRNSFGCFSVLETAENKQHYQQGTLCLAETKRWGLNFSYFYSVKSFCWFWRARREAQAHADLTNMAAAAAAAASGCTVCEGCFHCTATTPFLAGSLSHYKQRFLHKNSSPRGSALRSAGFNLKQQQQQQRQSLRDMEHEDCLFPSPRSFPE